MLKLQKAGRKACARTADEAGMRIGVAWPVFPSLVLARWGDPVGALRQLLQLARIGDGEGAAETGEDDGGDGGPECGLCGAQARRFRGAPARRLCQAPTHGCGR